MICGVVHGGKLCSRFLWLRVGTIDNSCDHCNELLDSIQDGDILSS